MQLFRMGLVCLLTLGASSAMGATITQKILFPSPEVTAQALYDLYFDETERQRITRGHPVYKWDFKANEFSIGHGNFVTTGSLLEVIDGKRVVHTWKTAEYAEGESGLVVVTFTDLPNGAGAQIDLVHVVPDRLEGPTSTNWYYFHWLHWLKKYNLTIPIPDPLP